MKVTLYKEGDGQAGMSRVANLMQAGLQAKGITVKTSTMKPREIRILGKTFGGILTFQAQRFLPTFQTGIKHATDTARIPFLGNFHVVTIHDLVTLTRKDIYRENKLAAASNNLATWLLAKRCKLIITPSGEVRRQLIKHLYVDPCKVVAIHPAIHPVFQPKQVMTQFPNDFIKVLVVSPTVPRKRLDLLLEAAKRVPEVQIIHVGAYTNYNPEYTMRIAKLGKSLGKRYLHYDSVGDSFLANLYSYCDYYIHPSEIEGFGFPPLEALACGANVLASDIPTHRETLGQHATYFPLTQESIVKVLTEKPQPRTTKKERLIYCRENFNIEEMTNNLLEAYQKIN